MASAQNAWQFTVAWNDLDANQHMRNTAYLEYATQSRFLFLASQGFPPGEFRRLRIGPVVMRDTVEYRRELHHLDAFTLTLEAAGMSADGTRFVLANTFSNARGQLAAVIRSEGTWFDLEARRVAPPPAALLAAMQRMPRSAEFREIEGSRVD
jgi:acyl-CoA thioester hydrolase